jgi:hypothetical protein
MKRTPPRPNRPPCRSPRAAGSNGALRATATASWWCTPQAEVSLDLNALADSVKGWEN